jgi:hypothetical protein
MSSTKRIAVLRDHLVPAVTSSADPQEVLTGACFCALQHDLSNSFRWTLPLFNVPKVHGAGYVTWLGAHPKQITVFGEEHFCKTCSSPLF